MIFVHAVLYDIVYVHVDMMLLHPLLGNSLHSVQLHNYSGCSWNVLQLILIYSCYLCEGRVEGKWVYTL